MSKKLAYAAIAGTVLLLLGSVTMWWGEKGVRAGKRGHIIAKMNALNEPQVVRALYAASQAGVPKGVLTQMPPWESRIFAGTPCTTRIVASDVAPTYSSKVPVSRTRSASGVSTKRRSP